MPKLIIAKGLARDHVRVHVEDELGHHATIEVHRAEFSEKGERVLVELDCKAGSGLGHMPWPKDTKP